MKKFLPLLLILFLISFRQAYSTHLMGGSLTYTYIGPSGANVQYHVVLKVYRYCDQTGGGTAQLDASVMLGVYLQDELNPNNDKSWFETDIIPIVSQKFIEPPTVGTQCTFSTTVCVEEGIYESDIFLPPTTGGYHLIVERCCRNGNIVNLSNPGGIGMSYYTFIPPSNIINSSPQFNDVPVPYICAGDTAIVINNATDPDGDVLVYSFETPYVGYSGSGNAIPDPQLNDPYAMPIPTATYVGGYSVTDPFGAGDYASIDPVTGQTSYYIPNQGFFVVAIEIKEYRNGQLISVIRRDLQLIAIPCPPNDPPNLSPNGGSGTTSYTITEGQTICFPIIFVDPNGDSLYLTSQGNIFNSAIVNPPATLANASGLASVASIFCWSTECGQSKPAPYQFIVNITDNGCPPKQKQQVYSITVLPGPPNPVPLVSIAANPSGPICTGTLVTFTATPTFGGTSPVFQWQLNGVNVGTNSTTWSSSTLNNGDIITCIMTSNSVCVTTQVAVSNQIVMVVNPFLAPSVSISASPAGSICSGTNVTFTANPVNPGPTPTYQWQVNGVNVGTNSVTYSTTTLTMGSTVSVTLTANASCPSAPSNQIVMTVFPTVVPSVSIVANVNGQICPSDPVTFTATAVNGGSAPSYQWQVNGVNVGTNSPTYTSSSWTNGDVVQVIMTTSATCFTSPTATSNAIVMNVGAGAAPSVSISANPSGPVCKGANVIFTAVPTLGGASPSYQWKVNGINAGTNSSVFATSALNNGDVVTVTLFSSSSCASPTNALSNQIVMTVNPVVTPSVTISTATVFPVCAGTPVTFTAAPVNGGAGPNYQWQVSGVNTGPNSAVFTTTTLTNGQWVRCVLTSAATCVSPSSANSNILNVSINPILVPSISITANPPGPVCDGTPVTFSATITNGGSAPVFQWQVNSVNTGTNASTFSSSTLANNSIVQVFLTSNAVCAQPAQVVSNNIVMTVNPLLTPDVTISSVPVGPVCQGDAVTFTAIPVNGGSAPSYQWKVNNVNAGTNSPVFTSSTLNNNAVVKVILTSNALCATPARDTSNEIIQSVYPIITPWVSITAMPSGPVCDGTPVTFTADTLHGGTSPSFQWLLNGLPVGGNSISFSSSTLQFGDVVSLIMNSNGACITKPADTSNQIVMVVNPNLTPQVSITSLPADTICPNDPIQFTAAPVNGGINPVYEWTVNGLPAGNNSPVFISSSLQNGDVVRVKLTTSVTCFTVPTAFSNIKTITVNPNLTPGINIMANYDTVICYGTPMIYTASWVNGGLHPHFQWRLNSSSVGTDTSIFTSSTINNGDVIDVILTSDATCVLPDRDTSNQITTLVDPILLPVITIDATPAGTFCDGTVITYASHSINEGTHPAYQWKVNGQNIPQNNPQFITDQLQDDDTLECVLTSSVHCPFVNPVASNKIIIDRLPPLIPVISGTPEICFGKYASLNVNTTGGNGGPYFYSWDNNLGNDSIFSLSPPSTTTYTVIVSDSCSTPRSDSFTITVFPLPVPEFRIEPEQATILNPFFDFMDLSINTVQWQWSFGDHSSSDLQNPQHTYLDAGSYDVQLIATSSDGCVDSLTHSLYVEEVTTIYIPNTFSPNNDGKNDVFRPEGHAMPSYTISVYNRWGQRAFYTDSPGGSWNGKLETSGENAPEGVYVYRIVFSGDLKKKIFEGCISLIR